MVKISRKYVDLIRKASGKHANWDPPKIVLVGDYGYVEPDTGSFIREGNIFTDPLTSEALGQLQEKPILKSSPEDDVQFAANAFSDGGGHVASGLGIPGDVSIKIKAAWRFTPENRGAVVAASEVVTHYLEPARIFPRLGAISKLKNKAIVTETMTCPAYALLLTDKGRGGSASLSLETSVSAAGLELSPGVEGRWRTQSQTGAWRTAYGNPDEKTGLRAVYTPLFVLRTTKKKLWPRFRGASEIREEYEAYDMPWQALDEDGEEVVVASEGEESPLSAQ